MQPETHGVFQAGWPSLLLFVGATRPPCHVHGVHVLSLHVSCHAVRPTYMGPVPLHGVFLVPTGQVEEHAPHAAAMQGHGCFELE